MGKEEKKVENNEEIKEEIVEKAEETNNTEINENSPSVESDTETIEVVNNDENTEKVEDTNNVENNENNEVVNSIENVGNPENVVKKKSKKSLIIILSVLGTLLVGILMFVIINNSILEQKKGKLDYYNGTYSFYVEDEDDSALYVTGLIKLQNGSVASKKIGTTNKEESGSYSIDKDKKINMYLTTSIYLGEMNGKDIEFTLKDGDNLVGYRKNKVLKLKYEGETSIFDSIYKSSEFEEKLTENVNRGKKYLNKHEEEQLAGRENPYTVTNEYDGVYSCYVEDTNDSGYAYYAGAYVAFENGKTYLRSTRFDTKNTLGYFGIENEKLVFELGKGDKYEAVKEEKNIKATLVSGYNITGNSNSKELVLKYVDSVENKYNYLSEQAIKKYGETIKEKGTAFVKKADEKLEAEKKEKYKASCQTYTYDELARNPSGMKGKPVKVTGEVIQSMKSTYGNSVTLRVNITKWGTYSTYYKDTVYVTYTYPDSSAERILEDDIITIYGDSTGETSYQSTLGGTITIPSIDAKYIERN